ncbi:MAG: helix-turn-helix transcriptional regulator [Acetivibrio ethanolgignens]
MVVSDTFLKQLAQGLAGQFGSDCEIVIHDLSAENLEHSVVHIENGHVSHRKAGDGPSRVVLEAMKKDPDTLQDHIGYLTKTSDGRILKSSTIYFRNSEGALRYLLAINFDITNLLILENSLKSITSCEQMEETSEPAKIVQNVNDLLDDLIEQSVALVGRPVALMTKEDKIAAIKFLNDAGAFLITKSGDKISKYFGISKYTLYSYIDINK